MNHKFIILSLLAMTLCSCNSTVISDGCVAQDTFCSQETTDSATKESYLYLCKQAEDITFWEKLEPCAVNACDSNKKVCQCPTDKCAYGCNANGTCACAPECSNGCKEDGSCDCSKDCKYGCEPSGACKCPTDKCKNGCDADDS